MKISNQTAQDLRGLTMNGARRCGCGERRVRVAWYASLECTNCGQRRGRLSNATAELLTDNWKPLSVHVRNVIEKLQVRREQT